IRAYYGNHIPFDQSIVVRSSVAVANCSDASFAGQHESYLHVVGEQALLAAVVRCWSSLWTVQAIAYRAARGIVPTAVSMGVVVQLLIPARKSGVLFTANPVTGDANQMVINATWGVGSVLGAGEVTPDVIIADHDSGDVIESQVANKPLMLVLAEG